MNRKELQIQIDKLGPWYQNINIDGVQTLRKRDTEQAWEIVETTFPMDYKNAKILDLGCNAGYYSLMAAKRGASVVGIEFLDRAVKQAHFLKEFYENKWSMNLDITYIQGDMSDIDYQSLGKFDCVFAFAILYHIGTFKYGKGSKESFKEQDRVMTELTKLSDKFIVRARERFRRKGEYYNPTYYNRVFKKFGFKNMKTIIETKGNRSFILYEKE